ncbi:MAG: M15 family metallopeptidase [Dehalococcoidales bacterium]|nr:M15 family metallopeptidase [Dehalococcoidales bacterium]
MPPEFVQAFKDEGFEWGGDWADHPDPMHFEWAGWQAALAK